MEKTLFVLFSKLLCSEIPTTSFCGNRWEPENQLRGSKLKNITCVNYHNNSFNVKPKMEKIEKLPLFLIDDSDPWRKTYRIVDFTTSLELNPAP